MATKSTNIKKLDFVLICIIFPALFGGVVEIIQPLLHEPRTASWIDWMADLIGVITGFGCMKLIFNKLQK
jgi:VanZ family protein